MSLPDTPPTAMHRFRLVRATRPLGAILKCAALVVLLTGCGDNGPAGVSNTSAPSAPSGVTAVAGDGSMSISWGVVAQATGYRVYWDTAGSVDTSDSVIAVTLPKLAHSGLANGTNYYYRVSALNAAGESALSAQVTAMPTGAAVFRLIACGAGASFLVNDVGWLFSWGNNTFGQLGIGSFTHQRQPTVVRGIGDIVAVAAGNRHVIVLSGNGRAYGWGSNDWGEVGDGSRTRRWSPHAVTGPTDFVAIAAGAWFSLGVTSDGSLWTWGRAPGIFSGSYLVPTKVTGVFRAPGIVAAGDGFSLFKPTNSGQITTGTYSWGSNQFGQLGDGTTDINIIPTVISGTTDIASLSVSFSHVVGIRDNGGLVVWGRNLEGQLGDGTTNDSTTPIPPLLGATVTAAGAGSVHTAVLQTDGRVMTWGFNESGQLGNGTFVNSLVPVAVQGLTLVEMLAVGGDHNLAVLSDGSLWAWGSNSDGVLGDGTVTNRNVPVRVTGY